MVGSPDPRHLTKSELAERLQELTGEEEEISAARRALHAEIDDLRREVAERLRQEGTCVIAGDEVAAAQAADGSRRSPG